MLANGKIERFFCTNNDGKDLFFVELSHDEEINIIHFECSLRYPIYDNGQVSDIISKIVDLLIPDSMRHALITKLFEHLQTLPNIESGYFPEYLLSNTGKYQEYYDNVTSALLRDKDFNDYTVFTSEINGFYFDYGRPILEEEIMKNTAVSLSKNTFEDLVKNDEVLGHEYVNLRTENTLYFKSIVSDETEYECYGMAIDFNVKLFFVRKRK